MNLPRTRQGCRALNAVLTPDQVLRIRELGAQDYSLRQIKATLELTCHLSTIHRVLSRQTYDDHERKA